MTQDRKQILAKAIRRLTKEKEYHTIYIEKLQEKINEEIDSYAKKKIDEMIKETEAAIYDCTIHIKKYMDELNENK